MDHHDEDHCGEDLGFQTGKSLERLLAFPPLGQMVQLLLELAVLSVLLFCL
jgi:hypothetical protein